MYKQVPHETFFNKSVRIVDQGLKIAGTMKGIYELGSAVASGARMAAPVLALL